ncbi:thiamine phosphate synthase [Leeuwenhoekiella sp. W20_SRS_FM14]|uniref:thiamine phosphate synthase n=1 Tax=Leeuwenhoekiella sp. W20_SRS_FM14 TaxID=3240270 RepID=UPI003F980E30
MIIPKLHYRSQGNSSEEHLENIQKACTSGIELVQLDFEKATEKQLLKLAKQVREITSHFQTRLILTDHHKIAREIKADGVCLEKTDLSFLISVRNHLYTWQIIGAGAHRLQECEALIVKDIDYINLNPFKTTTKLASAKTGLGLNGYSLITDALTTETPILGAGGITPEDVKDLMTAGISGIVVSDYITQDFNSIKTFNQLLKASATEEQRHTFE